MRSPWLTAPVLVAALAIAACGGDDDSKKARTTTATAPAATATVPNTPAPTTTTSKDAKRDPAAGRVVRAFFNEMSERDGATACGYLNRALQQTAIQLIRKLPGNGSIRRCGAALTMSVSRHTAAQLRTIRDVTILSSTAEGALATVKVRRSVRDVLLTKSGNRWVISSGVFNTR